MEDYIKIGKKKRHSLTVYLNERDKAMLDELRANFDINVSKLVRNEIEKAYIDKVVKPIMGVE